MEKICTGNKVLNKILAGGLESDSITTIYGPPASGKTNFAILAAVSLASKNKKVIYIDTEGGFSIERLKQVAKNYKKVLNNITFLKPTNFEEQKKSFEKLNELVNKKIGLIIVDTISMLYRLKKTEDDEIKKTNQELSKQVGLLNELVRKNNIPVLLISQVYTSFDDGKNHIVGGDIIKYGSNCLIELQNYHLGKRKIILRKHRSIGGEKQSYFEIIMTGVKEI